MKMIDYRPSAADDFNLPIFSGTSHRNSPVFWWNFFRPLKPERLWIVGGLSGARQTRLLVRSSYQCRPGSRAGIGKLAVSFYTGWPHSLDSEARQLGDIRRDPPRFIFAKQLGRSAARCRLS
jgi:hypothetical protein